MKKNNTRQMVQVASLSAISIVFFAFSFRVIPGIPLKADLSDFPVMIAAYTMGPVAGVLVALLKNIIHVLFLSTDGSVVGELANFAFAIFIMLPVTFIKDENKKKNILILFLGLFFAAGLMHLFNYYITFPLYGMPSDGKADLLLSVFLPFNFVKGLILYGLFILSRPYFDRIHQ